MRLGEQPAIATCAIAVWAIETHVIGAHVIETRVSEAHVSETHVSETHVSEAIHPARSGRRFPGVAGHAVSPAMRVSTFMASPTALNAL